MARHLLFYVYPTKGNGEWQRNVDLIKKRLSLFDGLKLCVIITPEDNSPTNTGPAAIGMPTFTMGQNLDTPRSVRSRLGRGVEYITRPNDPFLREAACIGDLWSKALGKSRSNDYTFYCHAKGVARPAGVVREWTEWLYETNLDYWPLVKFLFRTHHTVGAFKRVSLCWPGASTSTWHYSGSFYWIRNSELVKKDWRRIDPFWGGIESWPSLHFTNEQAGCQFWEFHDGPTSLCLYSDHYRSTLVAPALELWRKTHADDKTEF